MIFPMTKSTPPGWYPDMADSRGLERYWNGTDWDNRFRHKGSTKEFTQRPGDSRAGTTPPKKTTPAKSSEQPSAAATVIGAIILIVIVGYTAVSCFGGEDDNSSGRPAGTDGQSSSDLISTRKLVEQTCREAVENRLKSPSSAGFSDVQARQDDSAGTRWTVTGKVDSENSFGASIRNTFTCTSTYDIASETARTSVTSFSGN